MHLFAILVEAIKDYTDGTKGFSAIFNREKKHFFVRADVNRTQVVVLEEHCSTVRKSVRAPYARTGHKNMALSMFLV